MAEKKLSFEQAMARLDELVTALEGGEAPLEDSLAMFEEGTKLMRQCAGLLDKAEQKVTLLTADPDGAVQETPFRREEQTDDA